MKEKWLFDRFMKIENPVTRRLILPLYFPAALIMLCFAVTAVIVAGIVVFPFFLVERAIAIWKGKQHG